MNFYISRFSQMLGSMGGMGQQPHSEPLSNPSDQTAADGTASSNPMESFLQV